MHKVGEIISCDKEHCVCEKSVRIEGIRLNIVGDKLVVYCSFFDAKPDEIERFKNSPFQIGVIYGLRTLILGYKIKGEYWHELYYSYHYSKHLADIGEGIFIEPTIEELGDSPLILQMYLLNASNWNVLGKREFTLTEEMKQEAIKALHYQKTTPIPLLDSNTLEDNCDFYDAMVYFLQRQASSKIVKNLIKQSYL